MKWYSISKLMVISDMFGFLFGWRKASKWWGFSYPFNSFFCLSFKRFDFCLWFDTVRSWSKQLCAGLRCSRRRDVQLLTNCVEICLSWLTMAINKLLSKGYATIQQNTLWFSCLLETFSSFCFYVRWNSLFKTKS